MRFLRVSAFLVLLSSAGLSGTTWWVPDDFSTIQYAINAAWHGDEVVVRPGNYVELIDFHGRAITVRSELGSNVTTIDGHGMGSVVTFANGEGPDSVLEGFTIKDGSGTVTSSGLGGGGVFCDAASPTIKNNTIILNWGTDLGGGIYCRDASSPIIIGNTITANFASGMGGGICCRHSSSPTITGNTIEGNWTAYWGGGICCRDSASPLIANNIIVDNAGEGGGIHSRDFSSPTITGNTIVDNGGGGIFISNSSSPTITGNIIAKNWTLDDGGGICCNNNSFPTITGNTITGNTASGWGGGICSSQFSSATITNTILWGNSAPVGSELCVGPDTVSALTISYSDVEGGLSGVHVFSGSTLTWGVGMIDADPLFIDPANGDHRLRQDPCQPGVINRCIDSGDPRSPVVTGTTRTDLVQDDGVVDLGYHYRLSSIPGAPYCYGDPGSGTPCPCSNDNDGGVPGSGCANGAFTSGARLTGNGTASVSADTLVLTAVRQEPNNSGLFFQADNDLSPGNTWGDGLRCGGGNLIRLQVQFADGDGTSSTDIGISSKAGNVQPGDTKYYQCWYRNPLNSPCGHQFNATNGYAITWLP